MEFDPRRIDLKLNSCLKTFADITAEQDSFCWNILIIWVSFICQKFVQILPCDTQSLAWTNYIGKAFSSFQIFWLCSVLDFALALY